MSVSAMTMAMLLTGAGEVQGKPEPATPAPMLPPPPIMVPYPPAPPPPMMHPPIIAVPGPPAPPPPGFRPLPSAPVRARMNLNSYFSVDDYPAEALRFHQEGTVGVGLVIGPDGRISDCTIADSSGSPSLDNATCRILRSRARYIPARDFDGEPTRGRDMGRVSWRLPRPGEDLVPRAPPPVRPPGTPGAYPYPVLVAPPPLPPPAPWSPATPPERVRADLSSWFSRDDYPASALRGYEQGVTGVRLTVSPEGRVSDCMVTASSGSSALDQATCRILRSRARYRPARDNGGAPTAGIDVGRIRWTLPRD